MAGQRLERFTNQDVSVSTVWGLEHRVKLPVYLLFFTFGHMFYCQSGSIMDFNVGIKLLMLKTVDAAMCSNGFMCYHITSLYHAHVTDFDCLFVGYCSKASAQYDQ